MTPSKRDLAVAAMDHRFHAACEVFKTFLRGSGLQTHGSADFATLHLITRSLADLGWAQNAATAGFPIQALLAYAARLESSQPLRTCSGSFEAYNSDESYLWK